MHCHSKFSTVEINFRKENAELAIGAHFVVFNTEMVSLFALSLACSQAPSESLNLDL